jgi:hypothetical protein
MLAAVVVRSEHSVLAEKFSIILPILDERQRRLLLAAEAKVVAHVWAA